MNDTYLFIYEKYWLATWHTQLSGTYCLNGRAHWRCWWNDRQPRGL